MDVEYTLFYKNAVFFAAKIFFKVFAFDPSIIVTLFLPSKEYIEMFADVLL